MTVNTTVTPIPTQLLTECAHILEHYVPPRVKLNTYNSVVYTQSLTSEFISYFHLPSINSVVCIETVTVTHLPTHRDVYNPPGSRMPGQSIQRASHCVLNCEPRDILLTVGGVHIVLPSQHWYLLNSQTPHSAVCEPPHRLITVDAQLSYTEYSSLFGL